MAKRDLQVNFRMPAVLKKALEVEAGRSGRSLSAEIVNRLQNSLVPSDEVVVINAGGAALREAVKQAFRELEVERVAVLEAVAAEVKRADD